MSIRDVLKFLTPQKLATRLNNSQLLQVSGRGLPVIIKMFVTFREVIVLNESFQALITVVDPEINNTFDDSQSALHLTQAGDSNDAPTDIESFLITNLESELNSQLVDQVQINLIPTGELNNAYMEGLSTLHITSSEIIPHQNTSGSAEVDGVVITVDLSFAEALQLQSESSETLHITGSEPNDVQVVSLIFTIPFSEVNAALVDAIAIGIVDDSSEALAQVDSQTFLLTDTELETIVTPVDTAIFSINDQQSETNNSPTVDFTVEIEDSEPETSDTDESDTTIGLRQTGDANVAPVDTESFHLNDQAAETNDAQTETNVTTINDAESETYTQTANQNFTLTDQESETITTETVVTTFNISDLVSETNSLATTDFSVNINDLETENLAGSVINLIAHIIDANPDLNNAPVDTESLRVTDTESETSDTDEADIDVLIRQVGDPINAASDASTTVLHDTENETSGNQVETETLRINPAAPETNATPDDTGVVASIINLIGEPISGQTVQTAIQLSDAESETETITINDSDYTLKITQPDNNDVQTSTEQFNLTDAQSETNNVQLNTEAFRVTDAESETNNTPTPTATFNVGVTQTESNVTPTNTTTFAVTNTQSETNSTQAETDTFKITDSGEANTTPTDTYQPGIVASETNAGQTDSIGSFKSVQSENNATPTEGHDDFVRYWAVTTSDNDSSKTNPTNADGANNGVFAVVSTMLSFLDFTNPVDLTSTAFGTPSTGTPTSKKIRVYFNIPAATGADTINLQYNDGSGFVNFYTHGAAAVNHNDGSFTFDISGWTMTQIAAAQLRVRYNANNVLNPVTQVNLDAWCIELEGLF